MAVVTTRVDDLDNDITDGVEEVKFMFDGVYFTIDLGPDNKEKFEKAIEEYINAASPDPQTRHANPGQAYVARVQHAANQEPKRSKEELQAIRDWANANGLQVAEKGRIAQSVVDQYEHAMATAKK